MMRIHTKKMLPADAGSFKQKEAELSGEYDWKVSFTRLFDWSWIVVKNLNKLWSLFS